MAAKTLLDLSMEGKEVDALDGTELMLVEQYDEETDTYISRSSLLSLLKTWITNGLATTSSVTAAVAASLDATVNTQSVVTSYTVGTVSTDNDGKTILRMNNASANKVTIPSTQTKPISIRQVGTGTTTLAAGSGVTLNGTLAFTAQHQTKTVIPLGSGIYDVVG